MSGDKGKTPKRLFVRNSSNQIRAHCAWIMEVSDAWSCADWLIERLEMGLFDDGTCSRNSLKLMIAQCQQVCEKEIASFRAQLPSTKKGTYEPKQPIDRVNPEWEERRRKIIRRDEERRAQASATRRRLEQAHKKPSAIKPPSIQDRMADGWKRNRHLMETRA